MPGLFSRLLPPGHGCLGNVVELALGGLDLAQVAFAGKQGGDGAARLPRPVTELLRRRFELNRHGVQLSQVGGRCGGERGHSVREVMLALR